MKNPLLYRFSQFVAFLMGAKVFVAALLTFALYVSTFFLFNQEESLRNFVFDLRVNGIIGCSVLSILAGGIINQFYDRDKDRLTKPFRTRLQSFLKQKYFLYAYLLLNTLSLTIAAIISERVFIFFLIYQFLMWFYSHKLNKIIVVNNLTFVGLSLYPFFGMLVYYRTFSFYILLLSVFIFLMLMLIDVTKDTLTKNADRIFGYATIPNVCTPRITAAVLTALVFATQTVCVLIVNSRGPQSFMNGYFLATIVVLAGTVFMVWRSKRTSQVLALNVLRVWIFIGVLAMLCDGISGYLLH